MGSNHRIPNSVICFVMASPLLVPVMGFPQAAQGGAQFLKTSMTFRCLAPLSASIIKAWTQHGRLYISHMNADQMIVFDTAKRQVVANHDGFSRVHGVWLAPEISRVYASVNGEHAVAIVDSKTLRTLAKVGPINYPDGLTYAPKEKRVFVSDEHTRCLKRRKATPP